MSKAHAMLEVSAVYMASADVEPRGTFARYSKRIAAFEAAVHAHAVAKTPYDVERSSTALSATRTALDRDVQAMRDGAYTEGMTDAHNGVPF